eukprot:TRINITY_DN10330_c0_g1_i2.p1 TRINITY_DN10330_c0_g1~~TRINITY_DN10330_c0_g1_i2.p1  ORF type:complete len:160 (+),score=23.63 TRINITY_DN10330_c0_g1_i2:122-601(+)
MTTLWTSSNEIIIDKKTFRLRDWEIKGETGFPIYIHENITPILKPEQEEEWPAGSKYLSAIANAFYLIYPHSFKKEKRIITQNQSLEGVGNLRHVDGRFVLEPKKWYSSQLTIVTEDLDDYCDLMIAENRKSLRRLSWVCLFGTFVISLGLLDLALPDD